MPLLIHITKFVETKTAHVNVTERKTMKYNILDLDDFKNSKYYNGESITTKYTGTDRITFNIGKINIRYQDYNYEFGPFNIIVFHDFCQVINGNKHPHVSNGGTVCLGNALRAYCKEYNGIISDTGGYLLRLVLLVEGVLNTYSPTTHYRTITVYSDKENCGICSKFYPIKTMRNIDGLNMCTQCRNKSYCERSRKYVDPIKLYRCITCKKIHLSSINCK